MKPFNLNTDDYRNQDTYEANLERTDKESAAITKAFIFWRAGLQPNEAQRKWLEANTDYAYCDSQEEFYASYGFLDANSHDLTEYGNRVLSEAEATAAMTLYLADCTQNAKNTYYKTAAKITCLDDLKRAARKDHLAVQMKNSYRNSDNFMQADCVMLDMDNTHSDDPDDWRTIDDIAEAFPGVKFYYIRSRNHMKEKRHTASDGTVTCYAPREKDHVYFPLSKTFTDFKEYENLMLKAAGLFPFFDLGAAKPAQFFFGVSDPDGGMESGTLTLDQFVNAQPKEAIIEAVTDFESKMISGTYTRDKENEKAISRLRSCLGVPAVRTDAQPLPAQSGEEQLQADMPYSSLGYRIGEAEQRARLNWLQTWAAEYNVPLGTMYRIRSREHPEAICVCVTCPWEKEHSMNGPENETVIIIELGGKLNFLCRHSHGAKFGWKDFRAFYEDRAAKQKATTEAADTAADEPDAAPAVEGLLLYEDIVREFQQADDDILEIKAFPEFSRTAKIKRHSSVVIAADTGGGKSSLALNFLNDLSAEYPCIYFNLEMDKLIVLRRLIAIQSGIEIDRIEGYKNDPGTASAVDAYIRNITSRKPIQIIQDTYTLDQIETIIETSTRGREEPTMVFIDHSLLVEIGGYVSGRYERFTLVSERLRKIALKHNIVLFVLLQQNRTGKADENEKPKNSSLKESGSWENDATQICFLWYDTEARRKKLLLTKNRNGDQGEFVLNYWRKTQTYTEAKNSAGTTAAQHTAPKATKREKAQERLLTAYNNAAAATDGKPTLRAIAEAADVTTATVKGWIREYGGCIVDGVSIDPAGIDTAVEYTGFVKLTPADSDVFETAATNDDQPKKRR